MSPKFGTSGLRGLVTELSDDLVAGYVTAFLSACRTGGVIHVGYDLRPSSPHIAACVIAAVENMGLVAIDQGALPTPALALASINAGQSAIMVTGSHIPADRNGLKFYLPKGEINKEDEAAIVAAFKMAAPPDPRQLVINRTSPAGTAYVARYVEAFGPTALSGLRIGVYEHSSVARDIMGDVMRGLGAVTVPLARSDRFIPVDTEAVDQATRVMFKTWAHDHALDAIVSTDGDGDRPMLAGRDGAIIAGDILGPLTAVMLGADILVTPVSSNGLIERLDNFSALHRTRIGSPYVISAMDAITLTNPQASVVGYEANGGFILGFDAKGPAGPLTRLMTRDSMLPMIAPLVLALSRGQTLATLVDSLPACYTASGVVRDISTARSTRFIDQLTADPVSRASFFAGEGQEVATDLTDGLRITFDTGAIIHLRPSGNAPECRCYAQADDPIVAQALVDTYIRKLAGVLA